MGDEIWKSVLSSYDTKPELQTKIKVLEWPIQRPDVSPIENLENQEVKDKVHRKPHNEDEPEQFALED